MSLEKHWSESPPNDGDAKFFYDKVIYPIIDMTNENLSRDFTIENKVTCKLKEVVFNEGDYTKISKYRRKELSKILFDANGVYIDANHKNTNITLTGYRMKEVIYMVVKKIHKAITYTLYLQYRLL